MPQVWNDHISKIGNFDNTWKHRGVCETKQNSTCDQTEYTTQEIVQLSFTAPGGNSTRSVTGKRHSNPENQPTN